MSSVISYIRCTWQYHNETIFHLLIIFYCKDLNFFTFTNFANCSNIEFDYAMYIGQRATACAAVDSNNESTRASVFWIYSHRIYWYHLHTYVNELADAYMGENTYMQMPKQIQMHSLASAKVRWTCIYIYEPQKYANAKVTLRRICPFRGWSFVSGKPRPLVVWSEFAYNLYELASMARKMN